jgi:hypothetical protein
MTEAEIESFVRAFENGALPKSEWTHARHLLIALWYITRHGRDEATALIRDGIRRHNQRHDNPSGYHETITLAWVEVIDAFLDGRERDAPVSVLAADLLEECGDREYLLQFYSRERLFSGEARRGWLAPDLAAITGMAVRGSGTT